MSNNSEQDHQKFLDNLSPIHKELLKKSQESIKLLHASPPPMVIRGDSGVKVTPPLVKRIQPNTIIGGVIPSSIPKPFIQPTAPIMEIEKLPTQTAQAGLKDGTYTFDGFQDFFFLAQKHAELRAEKEVDDFVKFVADIPNKCGCVRGALNEAAQGQFSQFLPLIHARNPDYFNKLKEITNSSKLIFKERNIVLIEV